MTKNTEIKQNYSVFKDNLPSLIIKYGQGKFVLIRHKKIIAVFDTKEDAIKAAKLKFEDGIFSIQEITDTIADLGFYSHVLCHQ